MTIQQCNYVLTIAKAGSFNEAAKQLFIAQSTLSLSIKSLENELGIKIFERSGNGVFLTDDGSEFVKYARQIVENSNFVQERYKSPNVHQKLFIVTQHYDFIADIFGKMLGEMPDCDYNFALKEIQTHDVILEIEKSHSDIGVIAIKGSDSDILKRYINKKGVTFTPVLKAAPHIYMRKEHPLANREKLTRADLRDYPYIAYEQGEHNTPFFTEELTQGIPGNKLVTISDRATLMNVLMISDSYTIGTGIMPSALNKGYIVSVPLESDDYYMIGYLLNANKKTSPLVEKFIKMLCDMAEGIEK
ncbi:MAG: LysR family transcriptional regulator [Clostridia bacterium]|nr:LysR family transcriptional regulator [Clostridia bacterium]